MKLVMILSAVMPSAAAWADDTVVDSESQATVSAPSFQAGKKDCNCAQSVQNTLPANNRVNDVRVVNFLTDPSTPGTPPAFDSTVTH